MKHLVTSFAAVLTLAAGGAQAATTQTYAGLTAGTGDDNLPTSWAEADAARDQFFSSLSGYTVATQDFESYTPVKDANGYLTGDSYALNVDFGVLGTGNLSSGYLSDEPYEGRQAISGTQYWDASDTFTLTFSQAVTGFGFYGTDFNDYGGEISLTLSNGYTTNLNLGTLAGGSVFYWGVVSDTAFTSVTFSNSNGGADGFGLDNITIAVAAPVPEPSSWAMLGAGLALMTLTARRKLPKRG